MRAILTNSNSGEIAVYNVPAPELRSGGVLVQTQFSVISSGTERASIKTAEKSIIGKALARPDLTQQVIDYARRNGIKAAYQKVKARLDSLNAIGYSCSGVVVAVAPDVTEFRTGDRVACAGVGHASHCEINFVPRNLAVQVPDAVPLDHAALTTIGAIAMQGIRQAAVTVGETVVVVGAGLLGVLTMQLARAAGCRVIAVDLNPERVRRARELGAHVAYMADDASLQDQVLRFSRYGADAALLTAAAPSSSAPLQMAAGLLRDRGRIVVVGDVGLGAPRAALYNKELSLLLSRSYGPGRYDPEYEEKGHDYPIGYVRWTEKRNMESFLDLLATGSLDVAPLLQQKCPLEEAVQAYANVKESRSYTTLISYSTEPAPSRRELVDAPAQPSRNKGLLNIGAVGAGAFARSVIFPALRNMSGVAFEAVATASGVAAESARKTDNFRRALSPADLISDAEVDGVFVLSHHDTHARYVIEALEHQKAVFVEKPLCSTAMELASIEDAYGRQLNVGRAPFVMVGFNRRFAPMTRKVIEFFASRREPMMVMIRVNAGYVPRDHWAQESGGRMIGEGCHFVDWARAVVGRSITGVRAAALPNSGRYNNDNIAASLLFDDGSIATVTYLANGDKSVPKETFEVFCEGSVAQLEDFRSLQLIRNGKTTKVTSAQDKGHKRELELTVTAMRSGSAAPIPFSEIVEVTSATLRVVEDLSRPFIPVSHGSVPGEDFRGILDPEDISVEDASCSTSAAS